MSDLMLTYHDPMLRIIEVRQYAQDGSERVRGAWQYAAQQPGWIARFALTVFFFIVMLPIIALLLIAFLVAAVIFLVLAAANTVTNVIRSVAPKRDGRQNVRVVRREDVSH